MAQRDVRRPPFRLAQAYARQKPTESNGRHTGTLARRCQAAISTTPPRCPLRTRDPHQHGLGHQATGNPAREPTRHTHTADDPQRPQGRQDLLCPLAGRQTQPHTTRTSLAVLTHLARSPWLAQRMFGFCIHPATGHLTHFLRLKPCYVREFYARLELRPRLSDVNLPHF
jgi:hypothetical protein